MTKELLYKCIEFRKAITQSDNPKQEIERIRKQDPTLLLALLIGLSITSIEELTIKY